MSYSLTARAATKAALLQSVASQLDQIVVSQPMHANDHKQAYDAVAAFVGIVPEADGMDFVISVHGSVGWKTDSEDGPKVITGAGVGVSVHMIQSAPAAEPVADKPTI